MPASFRFGGLGGRRLYGGMDGQNFLLAPAAGWLGAWVPYGTREAARAAREAAGCAAGAGAGARARARWPAGGSRGSSAAAAELGGALWHRFGGRGAPHGNWLGRRLGPQLAERLAGQPASTPTRHSKKRFSLGKCPKQKMFSRANAREGVCGWAFRAPRGPREEGGRHVACCS